MQYHLLDLHPLHQRVNKMLRVAMHTSDKDHRLGKKEEIVVAKLGGGFCFHNFPEGPGKARLYQARSSQMLA